MLEMQDRQQSLPSLPICFFVRACGYNIEYRGVERGSVCNIAQGQHSHPTVVELIYLLIPALCQHKRSVRQVSVMRLKTSKASFLKSFSGRWLVTGELKTKYRNDSLDHHSCIPEGFFRAGG